MVIIVQISRLKDVYSLTNEIRNSHSSKISKCKKELREIELVNGDSIKFISTRANDFCGKKADAAIGPDAEYITAYSKLEKRIWTFTDLNNHIASI